MIRIWKVPGWEFVCCLLVGVNYTRVTESQPEGQTAPRMGKKYSHKNRENQEKMGENGKKQEENRKLAPADGKGWLGPWRVMYV